MEQNPDEEYFKHLFIKKMDQMIAYNKKRKAQEIKLKERN